MTQLNGSSPARRDATTIQESRTLYEVILFAVFILMTLGILMMIRCGFNVYNALLACIGFIVIVLLYHNNGSMKEIVKNILWSFGWLVVLFLFAYPLLIEAYFNVNKDFDTIYVSNQCMVIYLFANVGFCLLTIYDYVITPKDNGLNVMEVLLIGIGVVCIPIIYVLSGLIKNKVLENYPIINYPHLVYWVHGLFLFVLFLMKYFTLRCSSSYRSQLKISEFN